jgi:hypothetical protein
MMEPRHLARRRPNCWFAYVADKPQYQDGSGQPSCPQEKSPHRPPWHSHCEAESYVHGTKYREHSAYTAAVGNQLCLYLVIT